MTSTPQPARTKLPRILLELITYNRDTFDQHTNLPVDELLQYYKPGQVNWVNLDGLENQDIIEKLQAHFNLHPLLIDDVLSDQRPKSEEFDDYLFLTMKMLHRIEGRRIEYEQISFVLGRDYLLTFQEKEGDLFDGFRERIKKDQGRVRKKDSDYLMYRLIDIIVENYYTVLDKIGEIMDSIEETVYENPSNATFYRIQALRKELIFLRKALFPLRDALGKIAKGESEFIEEDNLRFYADVYDHVVHIIDSLDTYKDLTSSLLDIHINAMNTRMNEVMKVLAVISTIFMPLTFIVGVYGMNFDVMPELHWKYSYYAVWGVMGAMVIAMLAFFKYKKWF